MSGLDPRKPMFLCAMIDRRDETLSGRMECVEGIFSTEAEAIECGKNICDEHPGCDFFVYRLQPIKRVWRGKIRVETL